MVTQLGGGNSKIRAQELAHTSALLVNVQGENSPLREK